MTLTEENEELKAENKALAEENKQMLVYINYQMKHGVSFESICNNFGFFKKEEMQCCGNCNHLKQNYICNLCKQECEAWEQCDMWELTK